MTVSSNSEVVALWGECGEFSMPRRIWQAVLGLACQYGWQPQGTLPPAPELGLTQEVTPDAFDGSYHPAYAQRIHVDDVIALASALERSLQDLPDHDIGSPATMSGSGLSGTGRSRTSSPSSEAVTRPVSGTSSLTAARVVRSGSVS
jgi:hypothetical protein